MNAATLVRAPFRAVVSISILCACLAAPTAAKAGAGRLSKVAVAGDPAPAEVGGVYGTIGAAAANFAGHVAFVAELAGSTVSSAVLLQTEEGARAIVRAGDDAPGGGRFASFGEVDAADLDTVLFRATLAGTEAAEGLFLWTPDSLSAVARSGDETDDGLRYATFSRPSLTIWRTPTGNIRNLAFVSTLTDSRKALLWWENTFDVPHIALITGESIFLGETEIVDDFVVGQVPKEGVTAHVWLHRKDRQERFERTIVYATPSSVLLFKRFWPGRRYRHLGTLKDVVGPPSVYFQAQAVSLLEYGREKTGLLYQTLGSAILAKTGDPAPGLSGVKMARFDPPLVNPALLDAFHDYEAPPVLVAAKVRLDDGRDAVWVGSPQVVPGQFPVRLELVGGSAGDGGGIQLESFTPLEVTDSGMLLVRGTAGDGDGIFVLSMSEF